MTTAQPLFNSRDYGKRVGNSLQGYRQPRIHVVDLGHLLNAMFR